MTDEVSSPLLQGVQSADGQVSSPLAAQSSPSLAHIPHVPVPPQNSFGAEADLYSILNSRTELAALKAKLAGMSFHAVFIQEGEPPSIQQFASLDNLVSLLRGMIGAGAKAKVYLFHGARLHISKGIHKYLLVDKEQIPLFDDASSRQADEDGNLCEEVSEDALPSDRPPT